MATQLLITEVHNRVDDDACFPAINPELWREIARSAHQRG